MKQAQTIQQKWSIFINAILFSQQIQIIDPELYEIFNTYLTEILPEQEQPPHVFLKTIEGTAKYMSGLIKKAFKHNLSSKIGYVFAKKGFDELKNSLDYKAVGGALLLGVNGAVVKAHGNSDERSFESALRVLKKLIETNVVDKIKEGISHNE